MTLFQLYRFCSVDRDEKMVVDDDYVRVMMDEVWPTLAVTSTGKENVPKGKSQLR
jgi:hypothetical protein